MKKLAIAFAGLAAIGFSGVAFADEATTTNGPAAMTDAEMDGVTAGNAILFVNPPCNPKCPFFEEGLPPKAIPASPAAPSNTGAASFAVQHN